MRYYLIFWQIICIHITQIPSGFLLKRKKKITQDIWNFRAYRRDSELPLDIAHRFFYLALRFILGSFACTDISISPRTRVSIFRSMKRRTFARGSTSRHAARVRAWNAAPGSGFCNIETGVLDVASRRSNLSRVYTYTGCLVTSTRGWSLPGQYYLNLRIYLSPSLLKTRFSH